jgi:hypothetical protein
MTAFLPPDDPHAHRRTTQLKHAQQRYEFNDTHVSPLALLDRVPIADEFTSGWLKTVGERAVVGRISQPDSTARVRTAKTPLADSEQHRG